MDSINLTATQQENNSSADGEFFHLTGPDEPSRKAEWGKGNEYAIAPDGETYAWRFQRPFRCIVRKQQMGNIIWSGWIQCLISDRVLNLFRDEGVTGFEVHPADPRLMFPHDPKDAVFWLLTVTGWGGMARPESGITGLNDPTGLDRLAYSRCTNPGEIIDPTQWDGSDFFIVWPLPNYWWVTSKVANLLKEHKLKRFTLVPPQDLTFGLQSGEIDFLPGRLRQYFSEERAKQIGGPLGID
jgi:hypothetical protein